MSLYRLSINNWSQLFFASFHQFKINNNQYLSSVFITVFESSSISGKLLAGRINDYFMRKKITNSNERPSSALAVRLPIAMCLHLISAFALILYCNLLLTTKNITIFIFIAIIAGISSAGNVITLSVLSTEIGNKKYQGLVTSLCNLATKRKKFKQSIDKGHKNQFYFLFSVGAFCSGYPFTLIAFSIGWHGTFTLLAAIVVLTLIFDMIFYVRYNIQSPVGDKIK